MDIKAELKDLMENRNYSSKTFYREGYSIFLVIFVFINFNFTWCCTYKFKFLQL